MNFKPDSTKWRLVTQLLGLPLMTANQVFEEPQVDKISLHIR